MTISSTQTTAGQSFAFGYTYTAGMALASETYPSGRVVMAAYDDAGRAKYVKGQNGGVATYYAGNLSNAIQYASHGAISSMTMGNGIQESRNYNSSLQPTVIQAGSLLTILNCYQTSDDPANCGSLPVQGNSGNVQRQKITRGGQSWVENYTYDAVNRLATATETGVWSRTYGYDAYGNRWLSASNGVPVNSLTPTSSTSFDTATNRLAGSNTYDSQGNLTSYGSYTLAYDGEGRVTSASGTTPSTRYEYDGEGHRVRAHSCAGSSTCEAGSGASTTIFVYDAFGRMVAEYGSNAVQTSTSYFTQDHLGSTRLEMDSSGQAVKCSDYLPFGEEIAVGYGGRSSCFNTNDNRIQYTGKERDGETGLDYFLARYYSGAHGRFTSPDPLMASARISDPQTWNRYAYVRNNPINMIDPDGRDSITLDPSTFNHYKDMGWTEQQILNFFDGLPGADWNNSFYLYWDATLRALYTGQSVDYWGQQNDQTSNNQIGNNQPSEEHGAEITVRVIVPGSTYESAGRQPFPAFVPATLGDLFFQFGEGVSAMFRNYFRMEERGWIGADKYYHCMGNCEATSYGPGGALAAILMSLVRTHLYSKYWKEKNDWRDDNAANRCGQQGGNCDNRCGPYVPQSSPGKPPFPGW